jgi:hypothetical protein
MSIVNTKLPETYQTKLDQIMNSVVDQYAVLACKVRRHDQAHWCHFQLYALILATLPYDVYVES